MKLGCVVGRRLPGGTDFAALGENSLDTVALGPINWRAGSKESLTTLMESPGGQAATAAVACARLGWRSRYAGAVGDDAAGRTVLAALTQADVELCVITRAGASTRRAVVVVDQASGDRTVLEHRDSRLNLAPGEILDGVFTQTRVLLVDGSDPVQSRHAAHIARAAGVRTLVDIDRAGPEIEKLLRDIDVVVLPESLATALGGPGGLGRALAVIGQESGAAAVVATLGPSGALGWCRGEEVRASAAPVVVVDTTGAGDAFRAGFAASWLGSAGTDPDLAQLLADANLVAGLSCRALGAQSGLPLPEEVPARLRGGV